MGVRKEIDKAGFNSHRICVALWTRTSEAAQPKALALRNSKTPSARMPFRRVRDLPAATSNAPKG